MSKSYSPTDVLKGYRESGSDLHDIQFIFKDKSTGKKKQIGAHKFVVSLNSDVFKAQLFGSLPESGDSISIVDCSFRGFEIFLDILYGKEPDWKSRNMDQLMELHYLASKYLITDLREVILEDIKDHEVTKENIKDIFNHAETHSHLDNVSEVLYKKCDDFFICLSSPDVADMICHYANKREDIQLMMYRFRLLSSKPCSNCKQWPCIDGNLINKENVVIDAKLVVVSHSPNTLNTSRRMLQYVNANLRESKDQLVYYKYKLDGSHGERITSNCEEYKFRFDCK